MPSKNVTKNGAVPHPDYRAVARHLQAAADEARQRTGDALEETRVRAGDLRTEAESRVRRNPGLALAGAAGAGLLIGMFLGRRR